MWTTNEFPSPACPINRDSSKETLQDRIEPGDRFINSKTCCEKSIVGGGSSGKQGLSVLLPQWRGILSLGTQSPKGPTVEVLSEW